MVQFIAGQITEEERFVNRSAAVWPWGGGACGGSTRPHDGGTGDRGALGMSLPYSASIPAEND